MKDTFVLDACALIALLARESGYENIEAIIQDGIEGNSMVKMNQINLLEVYYHTCTVYDQNVANRMVEKIKEYPIKIITGLSENVFKEAGRIKSKYKIPLGDSIVVAECIVGGGILVTSDHTDIEKIEKSENLKIAWFR